MFYISLSLNSEVLESDPVVIYQITLKKLGYNKIFQITTLINESGGQLSICLFVFLVKMVNAYLQINLPTH